MPVGVPLLFDQATVKVEPWAIHFCKSMTKGIVVLDTAELEAVNVLPALSMAPVLFDAPLVPPLALTP